MASIKNIIYAIIFGIILIWNGILTIYALYKIIISSLSVEPKNRDKLLLLLFICNLTSLVGFSILQFLNFGVGFLIPRNCEFIYSGVFGLTAARIFVYLFFLRRLHITYGHTTYAYPNILLVITSVVIILFENICAVIYYVTSMNDCAGNNLVIIVCGLSDTLLAIFITGLFMYKLYHVLNDQFSHNRKSKHRKTGLKRTISDMENDPNSQQLLQLGFKIFILFLVTITSSITGTIIIGVFDTGGKLGAFIFLFDSTINSVCLEYQTICKLCRYCCEKPCVKHETTKKHLVLEIGGNSSNNQE